jgi:outer membrane lipoprotein-sorting protein
MENFTDEDNAFYILHVIRENGNQQLQLSRTIWFSRTDLKLARQLILDAAGNILTDARYSDWKAYDNVPFPKHIEINRPRDEYAVVIDIVKMDINKGVGPEKFALEQPEGTTLQVLGQPLPTPATPPPPAKGRVKKK